MALVNIGFVDQHFLVLSNTWRLLTHSTPGKNLLMKLLVFLLCLRCRFIMTLVLCLVETLMLILMAIGKSRDESYQRKMIGAAVPVRSVKFPKPVHYTRNDRNSSKTAKEAYDDQKPRKNQEKRKKTCPKTENLENEEKLGFRMGQVGSGN